MRECKRCHIVKFFWNFYLKQENGYECWYNIRTWLCKHCANEIGYPAAKEAIEKVLNLIPKGIQTC